MSGSLAAIAPALDARAVGKCALRTALHEPLDYSVDAIECRRMLLEQWVDEQGPGALVRLQVSTGLSYTAVQKAVRRTSSPDYDTARRLSEATDGSVSIAEICGTPRRKPRTKPVAAKPTRKRRESQPSAAARRA